MAGRQPVKVGILGAGAIAAKMAGTLARMDEAVPYAVASRDIAKAKAFAGAHGVEKAFGGYEEMLADPALELVYVATPNTFHHAHAKLCLEGGKHVLLEKPFTVDAREAEDLVALASSRGLLLAEAMWTRYLPFMQTIRRLLDDGIVGTVLTLNANIGNDVKDRQRLYDPALGGGTLLDLSVYTLNFALMTMGGDVERVASSFVRYRTGVDSQNGMVVSFASGRMATLFATMLSATDKRAVFYGDKGWLAVENLNNPVSARVFAADGTPGETFTRPEQISGFEYQVASAVDAIRNGRTECPEMPHAETLRVMRILDSVREEWGMRSQPR